MFEFKMYSPCCTWYLEVQTNCPKVVDLIETLFGGFVVLHRPDRNDLEYLSISIEKKSDGYIMTGKGKAYRIKNINSAGFYLYAVIDKLVEGNMDDQYCVFHGGLVVRDNQAYGIIAPTMTGKSTLIAYLTNTGYSYFSDDYIFVNRHTRTIEAMPLPISLRTDKVIRDYLRESKVVGGYNELKGEEGFLLSTENDIEQIHNQNCTFSKVFFITRASNNCVDRLSNGETCKELLFNLKNSLNLNKEMDLLRKMTNDIHGYKLVYKDFDYVTEVMKGL